MMPSWYSSLSLQLIIGMERGRTGAILGRAEDNSRHLKHRRLVGSEQSTNEQLRGTRDRDWVSRVCCNRSKIRTCRHPATSTTSSIFLHLFLFVGMMVELHLAEGLSRQQTCNEGDGLSALDVAIGANTVLQLLRKAPRY